MNKPPLTEVQMNYYVEEAMQWSVRKALDTSVGGMMLLALLQKIRTDKKTIEDLKRQLQEANDRWEDATAEARFNDRD